jgi:hypothetical protein
MKRFQSLLASFVLTFTLAASTAAGDGDGIIHTGRPAASPTPPPANQTSDTGDGVVETETTEGETTAVDLFYEAAFDCLYGALTLL